MPLQYSVEIRNAQLDSIEATIGASAIMRIMTGTQPASCSDPETGTVLAIVNLPSDWMNNASGGSVTKSGTWTDSSIDNTGVAGYFRIYDSLDTICYMQGSVTITGGGGDMTVDNTSFVSGQIFQVNSFSITAGNS